MALIQNRPYVSGISPYWTVIVFSLSLLKTSLFSDINFCTFVEKISGFHHVSTIVQGTVYGYALFMIF